MLYLTEVNLLNSSKKKTNSDIKTTPILILEKKYSLSYKKPQHL